ncbi:MAG: hypothetical protein ACK4LQ_14115 [Pararhodobacter sp.]
MKTLTSELLKLRSLLEQEREALMRADLERIDSLAARKATLLERLEPRQDTPREPRERQLADTVAAEARRNQALIESALAGVRDAQELIARVRKPRKHNTYDRDGRRETIGDSPSRLERRA